MPAKTSARMLLVLAPALLLAAAPPLEAQRTATRAQTVVPAAGVPAGTVVDPAMRGVDSLLAATYPAGGPGAAVLVSHGGRVLLRKGYGLANVELGVPITPENIFRIGSITKQFTAVAILLLADEGKLSLDDDITRFFPEWPTHGHRITVEHLLTHTSGIRSYTAMPELQTLMRRDLTLDELVASFRDEPMDFAPGTEWRYNNSGYVLLGAIVEKLSGQSYAEFVRTRLFEPLGMRDTHYEDQAAVLPRRATGYSMGPERELRNAAFLSMSVPHAAGALVSTVDDQLRWQQAVAERRLLRQDTWQRAFTPFRLADGRSTGYGHGWFVGTAAGARSIEHGGDINGFSSEGIWVPEANLHILVLSNAERSFANPTSVALRVAEQLLDASGRMPAAALSAEKLDEYVGVYRISDTEQRVVRREGETLFTIRGTGAPQELQPLGSDRFVYPGSGTQVTFDRGADGRVTAMRLQPRLGPEQAPSLRTDEAPEAALAAAQDSVAVPAAILDVYVGEYEIAPGFILTIRRDGEGIVGQATGQPQFSLLARSESRFSIREAPATIEFERDAAGTVTGLVLDQGGRRMPALKVR